MLRYARDQDEILKEQFSRVSSRDLYWENKTYNLKRSVIHQPRQEGPSFRKFMGCHDFNFKSGTVEIFTQTEIEQTSDNRA